MTGCFGLSAAINGPWLERNGPKLAAILGATIFFVGNMIAAVGIYSKVWFVLSSTFHSNLSPP